MTKLTKDPTHEWYNNQNVHLYRCMVASIRLSDCMNNLLNDRLNDCSKYPLSSRSNAWSGDFFFFFFFSIFFFFERRRIKPSQKPVLFSKQYLRGFTLFQLACHMLSFHKFHSCFQYTNLIIQTKSLFFAPHLQLLKLWLQIYSILPVHLTNILVYTHLCEVIISIFFINIISNNMCPAYFFESSFPLQTQA